MRARRWWWALVICCAAGTAAAEPKPKAVDIKPFKDRLVVLQDSEGGTYVVLPGDSGDSARIFYGLPKKPLYDQVVTGRGSNGSAGTWDVAVWSPRVPNFQPGSIAKKADGSFTKFCGSDNQTELTQLSSDKAKTILDKGQFMTTAMIRRPYMLARDDSGVYYYVDVIRDQYGGKGYRVFVGKKGAMKQKPLTDIANDSAGDVFATKTGDLRIVRNVDPDNKTEVLWVKGGKRSPLTFLNVEQNEAMIYKDLGVYTFTGNICDTL
jgi:hypothetical protein